MRFIGSRRALVAAGAAFVLVAAAGAWSPSAESAESATHLPISAFTSTQGQFTFFGDPAPYVTWTGSPPDYPYVASFDYAGIDQAFLVANGLPSLGTTITGDVLQRRLSDGRVETTVDVHTTNALTFVYGFLDHPPFVAAMFGTHAFDVLYGGATPTLGDCHLTWVFTMDAGQPIPDLWMANLGFAPTTGYETVALRFRGEAKGPLHAAAGLGTEGTPGRVLVSQTGNIGRGSGKGANTDGYPAESVELRATGR